MVELAAVEREIVYDKGIVLTGYDTALVPTGKMDRSVQWHVVFQEESERRSWFKSDGSSLFDIENRLKETSLDALKGEAYLGWGDKVNVTLGTDGLLPRHERTMLKEVGDYYVQSGYSRGGTFGIGLSALARIINVNFAGTSTKTFSRERACQTRSLHGNYQRRFRDLYVQMVVVYDTQSGRAWLVPKVNLVLLLVRMYISTASLTTPLTFNYPVRRNEDRKALDRVAWNVIASLEQKPIETADSPTGSEPTFGALFNDFAEDLHNALTPLEAHVQSSIYGIELMDIYDGKFGVLKMVPNDTAGVHQWSPILHRVGIVLCPGLDSALKLTSVEKQAESERFLWQSNSLCCAVGDLKLLMESQGCTNWASHKQTGRIEKQGLWKWVLRNDPFHNTCGGDKGCKNDCWQARTQRIEKWSNWTSHLGTTTTPPFTRTNMNSGICFGCLREL
jgi:hypothetical protein